MTMMNTNENDDKNPNESSNIVTTSMKSEHKMTNLGSSAYKMMIASSMIKTLVKLHRRARFKLNQEMYSRAQSSIMSDSCSFKAQRMDFIDGNLHSNVVYTYKE